MVLLQRVTLQGKMSQVPGASLVERAGPLLGKCVQTVILNKGCICSLSLKIKPQDRVTWSDFCLLAFPALCTSSWQSIKHTAEVARRSTPPNPG